MKSAEKRSGQRGVVYELRALTNRWLEPLGSDVVSTHSSPQAALDAIRAEPQVAVDGTGRTTYGNYVAKTIVRVDPDGGERMVLAPPRSDGILSWPYSV